MNEHSRSIDTRHHAIRQDYVDGEMRIGGVASSDNESDILTKYLQPPLHIKHTRQLHITQTPQHITNCVVKLTSNHGLPRDDPHTPCHCRLPQHQQLPLSPSLHTDRPPIMPAHPDDHPNTSRHAPTTSSGPMPEERVDLLHSGTNRHHQKCQPGLLQELSHQDQVHLCCKHACHGQPTRTTRERDINPDTFEMPPAFLDLIFPQHQLPNGHCSLPPRCCDKPTHTINKKTRKKHRKRKSEAL